MNLSFRGLAIFSALAFLVLAVAWMFAPSSVLSGWGVAFSNPVGLVGRRLAAMFAGMAVMFFGARNAPPSPARSAMVAGLVAACLILAVLGVFDLVSGQANQRILGAVVLEVGLPLAFLTVSRIRNTRTGIK